MVQVQTRLGKSLPCAGGLLAVFSFLVFPWISFGLFGSDTAIHLVLMHDPGNEGFLWSLFLWLELSRSGGIAILSLVAYLKKDREPVISLAIMRLAAPALLGVIGMSSLFLRVAQRAGSTGVFC